MDKIPAKCIRRSQKVTKSACDTSAEEKANLVCTDLYRNSKMTNCLKFFNMDVLMKNCIDDYCGCKNTYERTECICNGLGALVKDCRFRGVTLEDGWRDWQICRKIFNKNFLHFSFPLFRSPGKFLFLHFSFLNSNQMLHVSH